MNSIINRSNVVGISVDRIFLTSVHYNILNIVDGRRPEACSIGAIITNVLLSNDTRITSVCINYGAADMASAISAARLAGCPAASMTADPGSACNADL